MGVKVYYSASQSELAKNLGDKIQAERLNQGPFYSPFLILPSRNMEKWLKLELSQKFGIAANLETYQLENGLFELIKRLYGLIPGLKGLNFELLTNEKFKLLINLALLYYLDRKDNQALGQIKDYFFDETSYEKKPDSTIRVYQLSTRLSKLFRDYEFHHPEEVNKWIFTEPGIDLEGNEAYLYSAIIKRGNILSRLNKRLKESGTVLNTLFYYFTRVKKLYEGQKSHYDNPESIRISVYFYSLREVSAFHYKVIDYLSEFYNIHIFKQDYPGLRKNYAKHFLIQKWAKPFLDDYKLLNRYCKKVNFLTTKQEVFSRIITGFSK